MKLVVGLGNPGEKYANTRHNVGFMVVDALASRISNKIQDFKFQKELESSVLSFKSSVVFAKPQTFMNESGNAVKKLLVHYKIKLPDLWVIHDDLDIRLGEYKIQKGVGPKLHYGIKSIEEELKTADFWRVRVGVDNRESENRTSGEEYVLRNFTDPETKIFEKVTARITDELITKIQV